MPVIAADLVDGSPVTGTSTSRPARRAPRAPAGAGDWNALAELSADGAGTMNYRDRDVAPGRRYEYRLVFGAAGSERYSGHVWVDVPGGDLALRGVRPNPARGSLTVSLALAGTTGARLDLVDLGGRRVRSRDLSGLGPGRHDVRIDVQGLAAGAGVGVDWQIVAAANGIENPRLLTPGQLIDLNVGVGVGLSAGL